MTDTLFSLHAASMMNMTEHSIQTYKYLATYPINMYMS